MRRKALLILFGALAIVQLRTRHETRPWMYAIPAVPLAFGVALVVRDVRAWAVKRRETHLEDDS